MVVAGEGTPSEDLAIFYFDISYIFRCGGE
jgi:hypothetical protein